METILMEPLRNKPKSRVQLHIHLDGAVRHETLWEVMRQKGHKLPGNGSLEDLKDALRIKEPQNLGHFLHGFSIFINCLVGDLEVLERIGYEFVEDQARQSVAYCEARFSPHLLLPTGMKSELNGSSESQPNGECSENGSEEMKSDDILRAVLKGLKRGEEEFGTKVRVILCLIRSYTDWAWDVLRLCEEYRDQGVVGIDIAGDESGWKESDEADSTFLEIFQAAKEKGIHRTAHAGEDGPPSSVQMALENYGAERIGHGYRVIEDEGIYEMCRKQNVHFETCPHSSYLTGSIQLRKTSSRRHTLLRFAEDEVSFSINTDDPTLTFTTLSDEYKLLSQWGFTEAHITRATFQAALHSFLPPEEKRALMEQLKEAHGIIEYTLPSTASSSPRTSTPPLKPSVTFGTWAERA